LATLPPLAAAHMAPLSPPGVLPPPFAGALAFPLGAGLGGVAGGGAPPLQSHSGADASQAYASSLRLGAAGAAGLGGSGSALTAAPLAGGAPSLGVGVGSAAISLWMMGLFTLDTPAWIVVAAGLLQGFGAPLTFVPLTLGELVSRRYYSRPMSERSQTLRLLNALKCGFLFGVVTDALKLAG
jgi:hypothetical protein